MDIDSIYVLFLFIFLFIFIKLVNKDRTKNEDEHTIYDNPYDYKKMDNFYKKLLKIFKRKKQ